MNPTKRKTFETLYGLDKGNKVKEWEINVEDMGDHSVMTYTYGCKDGKKTECKMVVSQGKNVGKKNETTHFQQAVSQAQSKWNKKKDISGYKTSLTQVEQVGPTDHPKHEPKLPMLAQDYKKNKSKLKFPCCIQPKLDGYRMVYNPIANTMTTRTGKDFKCLVGTNLHSELLSIHAWLDGELYVHDSSFSFENYGVLRKQKDLSPHEKECLDKIEYHVYDCIDEQKTFAERLEYLQKTLASSSLTKIKLVQTLSCSDSEDVQRAHEANVANEYEGSVLRNLDGKYRCKYRSFDLLKYKDFDDHEFTIVDFTSERDVTGDDDKLVVWVCETESGKRFNVQSKGTKKERKEIYKRGAEFIGQKIWVQHFGYTHERVPRFPKTMRNGLDSIRNECA